MARKVPIDWDDSEMALTMHMEESACYLDLRTGKAETSVDPSLAGDIGPSGQEIPGATPHILPHNKAEKSG